VLGRSLRVPAALPRGNERTTASRASSLSVAPEGVRSGWSWRIWAARRANTARSAESHKTAEVSSWRALPGAPSARRARTAAAVLSDACDKTSLALYAAAPVLARVRGPSAGAARFTRATNSSWGSRTENRQLWQHCCVDETRVAFPPRVGAADAMSVKLRRRALASYVCSRSAVCSRLVRARAQLKQVAKGTLRSVESVWPAAG